MLFKSELETFGDISLSESQAFTQYIEWEYPGGFADEVDSRNFPEADLGSGVEEAIRTFAEQIILLIRENHVSQGKSMPQIIFYEYYYDLEGFDKVADVYEPHFDNVAPRFFVAFGGIADLVIVVGEYDIPES